MGFLYVKEGPRGLDGPTIEIRDPAFRLATGEGPEDTICAAVSSGSFRTRLLASGSLLRGVASCRTPSTILSNMGTTRKRTGSASFCAAFVRASSLWNTMGYSGNSLHVRRRPPARPGAHGGRPRPHAAHACHLCYRLREPTSLCEQVAHPRVRRLVCRPGYSVRV